MSDEALIREMREILERPEPIDGVELRDGFGTDYWIVTARPTANSDGDPVVEILVDAERADGTVTRIPVHVSLEVLDDIEESPAEQLAQEASYQITETLFDALDQVAEIDLEVIVGEVGSADETYESLLAELRSSGEVETVAPGVLRLTLASASELPIDIHVTPLEFHDCVIAGEVEHRKGSPFDQSEMPGGLGTALLGVEEILGTIGDQERFIVFFDGGFHASIRRDLPPVRAVSDDLEHIDPDADNDWLADQPEDD
ncbi:MAG: hypothetical protein JWR83_91 [Aeromicrobium sp.]|nr:hypothetical protein [Aeromicrobium sp.]